jgi:Domain of unknown function (DUF4349)
MRPFDEIPFEEADYSDVALLVASVREWPREDFVRELDGRVAQRFAPAPAAHAVRTGRGGRFSISRWAAGPVVALVAGAVAAVVVLSGGSGAVNNGPLQKLDVAGRLHSGQRNSPHYGNAVNTTASFGAVTSASGAGALTSANLPSAGSGQPEKLAATQSQGSAATAPVAPGSRQIRSAQITLTTPNQHVDQVASEVFTVVGAEHGSVLSSHITTATTNSGGGYAAFSLSIPTGNLQDAMTQLSRLHYAALSSSTDGSQNVSNQYNNDQRQLADARALRTSLLKQLQTAYTQSDIDAIKAQLKLAEQQINSWQSTLNSLQHRISYSNLAVQVNAGGLPVVPVHQSSSFTIGRAAHDALRVLVVSAGAAMIALAVALPIGLVAALLMWLWVWLRQRRREHALDAAA